MAKKQENSYKKLSAIQQMLEIMIEEYTNSLKTKDLLSLDYADLLQKAFQNYKDKIEEQAEELKTLKDKMLKASGMLIDF